jgi:hypothetical protein
VCVDRMVVPFGRRTGMPLLVGILLTHGLLTQRKWHVHPELAMAVFFFASAVVGLRRVMGDSFGCFNNRVAKIRSFLITWQLSFLVAFGASFPVFFCGIALVSAGRL